MSGSGTMNVCVHNVAGFLGRLPGWFAAFGRRLARARPDPSADPGTQEALRESEERLRLVRRATGLGMYEIDWLARRRPWAPQLRTRPGGPPGLPIDTETRLVARITPRPQR